MVAVAKGLKGITSKFRLQDGFIAVKPNKKWLNTKKLQRKLNRRSRVHIFAHGGPEQHDKLVKFCEKCLRDGYDETIVTVIGEAGDKTNLLYQCLFQCNDSKESFVLKGSFFRDFDLPTEDKAKKVSVTMPAIA